MNQNYRNSRMSSKDVCHAFSVKENEIYNLIGEGFIRKVDRFYKPTEKLLNREFLPKTISLKRLQRCSHLQKMEVIDLFGGDFQGRQVLKFLVRYGFLEIVSGRYCISDSPADMLAEGEDIVSTDIKEEV